LIFSGRSWPSNEWRARLDSFDPPPYDLPGLSDDNLIVPPPPPPPPPLDDPYPYCTTVASPMPKLVSKLLMNDFRHGIVADMSE
jgi:hypothetical protein